MVNHDYYRHLSTILSRFQPWPPRKIPDEWPLSIMLINQYKSICHLGNIAPVGWKPTKQTVYPSWSWLYLSGDRLSEGNNYWPCIDHVLTIYAPLLTNAPWPLVMVLYSFYRGPIVFPRSTVGHSPLGGPCRPCGPCVQGGPGRVGAWLLMISVILRGWFQGLTPNIVGIYWSEDIINWYWSSIWVSCLHKMATISLISYWSPVG